MNSKAYNLYIIKRKICDNHSDCRRFVLIILHKHKVLHYHRQALHNHFRFSTLNKKPISYDYNWLFVSIRRQL